MRLITIDIVHNEEETKAMIFLSNNEDRKSQEVQETIKKYNKCCDRVVVFIPGKRNIKTMFQQLIDASV